METIKHMIDEVIDEIKKESEIVRNKWNNNTGVIAEQYNMSLLCSSEFKDACKKMDDIRAKMRVFHNATITLKRLKNKF